jgi:hypothetical protein
MASATTPAPAPAASTPPVVVVSQNVLPQTLSYLQVLAPANTTSGVSASLTLLPLCLRQGRGLQVHSVPAQERLSAQSYNALHERISGAHGLLAFPGDTVDGELVKQAGPQFVAVSVAGRCVTACVRRCPCALLLGSPPCTDTA